MADLPDYYTQAQISEAEAASFKGGLDANKSDTPVSRDIYYATDTKILYVCVIDGTFININALYLLLAGGTMTGAIAMGTKKITGLGNPTNPQDAATRAYVLARCGLYLPLLGGTMEGNTSMGSFHLTGLPVPLAADEAARKGWIEGLFTTHVGIPAAHHEKYTDANAVDAMGARADDNPLHHDRAEEYSDEEAVLAVQAAGLVLDQGKSIGLRYALDADHTWTGLTVIMFARDAVTVGQAVAASAEVGMKLADADTAATMPAIALATATIADDVLGEFLLQGYLRDDTWDWTIGGIIYASLTPGALTQDVSGYTTGDQVQVVGVAISATIIYFNPSLELVEIS